MNKLKESLPGRIIRGILRPREVRLPLLFWVILLILLIFLVAYRSTRLVVERETRLVVATPTPGAPPTPGPSPTPVGSGGTVAFAMRHNGNSDIYLLSQNDGRLLRLTFDPAEDRDPAWSPDGQWLAFASRRAHNWDLYAMNMHSGTVVRLTRDPAFEGGPTWSPDGQWLAYESYAEGNLDIHILSIDGEEHHQITHDTAPDFSPAWSPDARHIAFTTLRDGNREIYAVSLDDGTLMNLTNSLDQEEDNAAWSHSAAYISYSTGTPGNEQIHLQPFDKEAIATGEIRPMLFGIGGEPTWAPDDKALAFIFRRDTTTYLIAANTEGWGLAQEGYSTTDWMESPAWSRHPVSPEILDQLEARMAYEESPLYTELLLDTNNPHYRLVDLPDVNGGDGREKLSDAVNDSYNALRQQVEQETGWDYLSILGDSWRPMNHTPRPGQGRISWHVCGRAVDINQGFLSDGRIELVREDVGGVTYWRVFIRAAEQDGSLGEPLRARPWDLSARSRGGLATIQGGELKAEVPQGYYVDFTTLAADFGWERRNALSGWRSSWFDIEWWHFQKTEGMSWYECMVEIYDEEEITASYGALPWWTKRPENEVQAYPW
ncbi:MAG: TolB family protein [Anaerolineae bacterium]